MSDYKNQCLTEVPHPTHIAQEPDGYKLDCSFNNIKCIPPGRLWDGLTSLRLTYNFLSTLPDPLPPHLTRLIINFNQFATFPPSILNLANLDFLSIANNPLTALPPEIANMDALRELYVGCTRITALPNMPPSLVKLDAAFSSHLARLPRNLCRIRTLRFLDIQHTSIGALPDKIGVLRALRTCLVDRTISVPPSAILLELETRCWATHSRHARLYWSPDYHTQFPQDFKQLVLVFVLCNRHCAQTYAASLPSEMIWGVLSFLYTTTYELHGGLSPRCLEFD
jgi:hypothetical protein